MLSSWVGIPHNRRHYVPFSFADRGDVWAADLAEASMPMMGGKEFASIAEGLIAGTLVATEFGWDHVENLNAGDRVVTFDSGMQRLKAVRVATLWTAEKSAPRQVWPLLVPAKALGNRTELMLLPQQSVLIESDEAEDLFGDPFTLVSADVLEGFRGIARVSPPREVKIVTLEFERDEVVYANGTTLVHCPSQNRATVSTAEMLIDTAEGAPYQKLPLAQSRRLVQAMQ
ncbi:MAG: Hint domain-containing protein [Paracoccaceae bacterium]